jgi:signal transduction histidine kinase
VRYQYRLNGAETEWGPPTQNRQVTYPRLPGGTYTFEVRVVSPDGTVADKPASVRFRVLPPFWKRWWFLSMAIAAFAAIFYLAYAYRARQRRQIEALRSRVASDLHDEIGSGLSQIAVLSEVAKRNLSIGPAETSGSLGRIGEISRDLLDSMSDIVWAINTQRKKLGDLTDRMRRFANEMFAGAGVELNFQAVDLVEERSIDLDQRRQIYLIFREAIRNVARHSRCEKVGVRLRCDLNRFEMLIEDNGIGIDLTRASNGLGLQSMQERARSLGGQIEWKNEKGTTLRLIVPLPE